MGVALSNTIGEDVGMFIEKNIFEPLHITKYEYGRCPEGYFYGASLMKLTVHDLSQIGLLLYNRGIYEGKRILSENYVKKATSVQQINQEGGYGYLIWKYRDGFSINGKWKQRCYVLPQRNIVFTYLAHIEDDSQDLLLSMEKNILGIEHTRDNGVVVVSVVDEKRIIKIIVEDQGPGVSEEEMKYLFRRFHRGNKNKAGYGIGLSMTKDIVEAHHGSINVKNNTKEGAIFQIELLSLDGKDMY